MVRSHGDMCARSRSDCCPRSDVLVVVVVVVVWCGGGSGGQHTVPSRSHMDGHSTVTTPTWWFELALAWSGQKKSPRATSGNAVSVATCPRSPIRDGDRIMGGGQHTATARPQHGNSTQQGHSTATARTCPAAISDGMNA